MSQPDMGLAMDMGPADMGPRVCAVDGSADLTRAASCPVGTGWFRFVRGSIESAGTPVEDAFPQVCVRNNLGNFACLIPEPSCPDGTWSKELTEAFRCATSVVMRTTKPSGGSFAATFCEVELNGEGILEVTDPIQLYAVDPAPNVPALGTATMARTVDLQEDVRIEVTPSMLETCFDGAMDCPDYDKLGVRSLTAADPRPCFVDPMDAPEAIFAFTTEIDVEGQGFPIRVRNTNNLSAGATVDLFTLGALACTLPNGDPIEEGDWVNYGTGTVSADGMFIEGRIPCLNWFGYKAR